MKYKIGEFSRITCFSIKTLRYYHDMGLLIPVNIDEDTGYRYYDENSYKQAQIIRLLREYEFTIKEIQEIMAEYEDENDLRYYLLEKNEMIQKKIDHYKKLQKKIASFEKLERKISMTTEAVKRVTIKDQLVASLTYVGRYEDVGEYLGKLYKAIGANAADKPFCIYHDEDYQEENAHIEVCLPIKKEISYKNIEVKIVPGGEGLSLLHIGPYENLSFSYKVITDYLINENIQPKSHIREQYLKGPGMLLKGNPEKYQTEISVLI